jgi:putative CocE/NonD family hydrolase
MYLSLRIICVAIVLCVTAPLRAEPIDDIKAAYTKFEHRIAMRDGKKLFTSVYVPKDHSKDYPILIKRTPYSCKPYGVDQYADNLGPSPLFVKAGYIFVTQDVRGRWMSEGEFVNMRPHSAMKKDQEIDESTDTYDTIEWLVKNVPHNSGKAGLWGISYPGFYTSAGMIDAHPALAACSPQAPICDWFVGDDWHHNGALMLPHAFNFMASFGRPRPEPTKKFEFKFDHETPDGYDFFLRMGPLANADTQHFKGEVAFWNEVMAHGTYDDFWKARNLRPHLKGIKPAVMTVGGWFDAENLFGALETYKQVERSSQTTNVLVMGPWNHGGWSRGTGESLGDVAFNSKTSEFYREHIELPFFEYYLKGQGRGGHPEAWVFETGTNEWQKHDKWPPPNAKAKSFYLSADGKLSTDAPSKAENDAHDEYVSDPAKPVPHIEKINVGMTAEYMVADQRHAARRPDVLVYQTEVLEQDLAIAGPIEVELHISTSGTDSDWIVKVIDVYPDDYPDPAKNSTGVKMGGYQQLLRGDVMRGKFRKGFESPVAFEPNKPDVVKFTMPDVCHVFRPGHRLMVQVQSTWFPLVDRNPQKFVDIYAAKESDFQKATQRVHRSVERASKIGVLVRE